MKTTEDAHGPLLDRSLILYGSACSTTHNARNCPIALVGARELGLRGGELTVYDDSVPLSNLYLTMLNGLGVECDRFSDSTGTLSGLFG